MSLREIIKKIEEITDPDEMAKLDDYMWNRTLVIKELANTKPTDIIYIVLKGHTPRRILMMVTNLDTHTVYGITLRDTNLNYKYSKDLPHQFSIARDETKVIKVKPSELEEFINTRFKR